MDRPTTAQLVVIAILAVLFAGLVIALVVRGGDESQPSVASAGPTPSTTSDAVAPVDSTSVPSGRTSSSVASTAPGSGPAGSSSPTTSTTSPCDVLPEATLVGPDADVEMDLVWFACGDTSSDGEAMFDATFAPSQPVVASGGAVALLLDRHPTAVIVGVEEWDPAVALAGLAADLDVEPDADGTYTIELPTTGCSAVVVHVTFEPGEGQFVGLAESALGACAAAA